MSGRFLRIFGVCLASLPSICVLYSIIGTFVSVTKATPRLEDAAKFATEGSLPLSAINRKQCVNGIPIVHGPKVCSISYDDAACEPAEWSYTDLSWTQASPVNAAREAVTDEHILEDMFVVTASNADLDKSKVEISTDGGMNVYRLVFVPARPDRKSRLELTTCFTRESEPTGGGDVPETDEHCPISLLSSKSLHTYTYDLFLPAANVSKTGMCVLTQWHGTAEPTIFKDEFGCIAQVPSSDMSKICSARKCIQGGILDGKGRSIGLRYQQGGYPPLAFTLKQGYFVILARSDERIFIEKAGCPAKGLDVVKCADNPKQQCHILWKIPATEYMFNRWVRFQWDIKWSEYAVADNGDSDGGVRISDAWIQVWMNGERIVNWTGPCGRNDNNRTPYFKAGVYNPSGGMSPVEVYFRGFTHTVHDREDMNAEVKKTIGRLQFETVEETCINQNVLSNVKNNKFASVPTSCGNECVLKPRVDHLSRIKKKLPDILADATVINLLKDVTKLLERQEDAIKTLEAKLRKCEENMLCADAEDDE